MTANDFDFLRSKLERVVYFAFVDIRNLSRMGAMDQIQDLADVAELIPEYLARQREEDLLAIRGGLEAYAAKYDGMSSRLLQILDMDEAMFNDLFPTERLTATRLAASA